MGKLFENKLTTQQKQQWAKKQQHQDVHQEETPQREQKPSKRNVLSATLWRVVNPIKLVRICMACLDVRLEAILLTITPSQTRRRGLFGDEILYSNISSTHLNTSREPRWCLLESRKRMSTHCTHTLYTHTVHTHCTHTLYTHTVHTH